MENGIFNRRNVISICVVAAVIVGAIIMLLIKINQNKNLEQMEESK